MIPQGFSLPEAEVDELLRTGTEIGGRCVTVDKQYAPEDNVELLLRTIRVLQLSLDVQIRENEQLVTDYNGVTNELAVSSVSRPVVPFFLWRPRLTFPSPRRGCLACNPDDREE